MVNTIAVDPLQGSIRATCEKNVQYAEWFEKRSLQKDLEKKIWAMKQSKPYRWFFF